MLARLINTLIGIWLTASPDILHLDQKAAINEHIAGPVAASVAIIAMSESVRSFRYVNTLVGFWLLMAPWILGYQDSAAVLNEMLAGALLVSLSLVKGKIHQRFGGGWRSLLMHSDK
ncbi:SPW repeat protein [Spirosoma sp. SC4-14]|uniref:SPW repeat protein n=1 Tax=Spirosoma sp. SC4-14 TaxID=3128900 RepID=UPI0030CE85D6